MLFFIFVISAMRNFHPMLENLIRKCLFSDTNLQPTIRSIKPQVDAKGRKLLPKILKSAAFILHNVSTMLLNGISSFFSRTCVTLSTSILINRADSSPSIDIQPFNAQISEHFLIKIFSCGKQFSSIVYELLLNIAGF